MAIASTLAPRRSRPLQSDAALRWSGMRALRQGSAALAIAALPLLSWSDEPVWPRSLYVPGVKVSATSTKIEKETPAQDRHKVPMGRCEVLMWVTADGYVRVAQVIKSSGHSRLDHACLLGVKGMKLNLASEATGPIDRWAIMPMEWEFTVGSKALKAPDPPPPSATLVLSQSLSLKASSYPAGPLERKEHGDSWVHVEVSDSGEVLDVKIAESSGSSELDNAALDALRAARFSPAFSDHKPINASADVVVSWVVPESPI
jgi:TonB family protein